MDNKKCTKCNQIKGLNDYYLKSNGSHKTQCKQCENNLYKLRRLTNPNIKKEYNQKYRKNNPNYSQLWRSDNPEYKEYNKQYYIENKEYYKQYCKKYMMERRKNDPLFKLSISIRNSIKRYIKGQKSKLTETILGCDFKGLQHYLENKFTDGMNWENYGKWHVDHIIPLASAKTEDEIYQLNHYTNLQPLWALDNQIKGKKLIS
jgi:hypothetical protein